MQFISVKKYFKFEGICAKIRSIVILVRIWVFITSVLFFLSKKC